MQIAQISDTHILAHASDHPSVRLRADWLRQCVADINNQQPDAVIFTGDTVQTGQPQEYEHLHELLETHDKAELSLDQPLPEVAKEAAAGIKGESFFA